MSIYAISDLHLSFNRNVNIYDDIIPEKDIYKPMDIFGWNKHYDLIRDSWIETITDKDFVLIPGDISWALKIDQALFDFNWISQLPGKKIISPGNHCYYAQSKSKMKKLLPSDICWLNGDYTIAENFVIIGTRGWVVPGDRSFSIERDLHIYNRQVNRLKNTLELVETSFPELKKIVMLHFPPVTSAVGESDFFSLLTKHNVLFCVYGHLHGNGILNSPKEEIDGVKLRLVSCDALGFKPLLII